MDEIGKVIKVSGGDATVQFERKTSCEKCGMCFASKDSRKVELTLRNAVNAAEGDMVRVSSTTATLLKSFLIVYGVPLLMFLAGLALAHVLFENDIITIVVGLAALLIGFFVLKAIDKKIGETRKHELLPKIVGIEQAANEENKEENIVKEI